MPSLIPSLLQHGPLDTLCQRALEKAATPFDFPANTHLLVPGTTQNKLYFIGSGIAMSHYLTKDKQFINWFAAEGDFAVSVEAFHHQQPSREYAILTSNPLSTSSSPPPS